MKTITINKENLRNLLIEQIKRAEGFDWSGWRIPIYVTEEGELSNGNWLSNNSWQPDSIEIPVRVEGWHLSDLEESEFNDDWTREDAALYYSEISADFMIQSFEAKIENDEMHNYLFELID